MSETNVTRKWTEMVKLSNKKDKEVSQNFIKLRLYDGVKSWADCLETMEMPKNCVLTLQSYREPGAGLKKVGVGS